MLKALINKGIYEGLSVSEQRKVRLLNVCAIIGLLISVVFLGISVFAPPDESTQAQTLIIVGINVLMFSSIYYLNISRKYFISRIMFIVWLTALLALVSIFAGITKTATFLSIIPTALLVIFLFERKREIIPLFLFCFGIFIFIIFNEQNQWIKTTLMADLPAYNAFFVFEIIITFVFLYVVGALFKSDHARFEKEITLKNNELQTQKQDIISSIEYSQKIQQAILPHNETIARNIPESFILYKPKQIVSGDFYWFHEIDNDNYIIICADCTGHGIPGAFMTVICCTVLNQVIIENKNYAPAKILNDVDDIISFTLRQETKNEEHIRDGMDLSMIAVNKAKKEIKFTSAKRPAFFIHNNEIRDIKGSKVSIGGLREGNKVFEEITIQYQTGDSIYLYTDGLTDQFGGSDNKKYMTRRVRELIGSVVSLPISEQSKKIDNAFENWRGGYEQTDDVCVIGIRF